MFGGSPILVENDFLTSPSM